MREELPTKSKLFSAEATMCTASQRFYNIYAYYTQLCGEARVPAFCSQAKICLLDFSAKFHENSSKFCATEKYCFFQYLSILSLLRR